MVAESKCIFLKDSNTLVENRCRFFYRDGAFECNWISYDFGMKRWSFTFKLVILFATEICVSFKKPKETANLGHSVAPHWAFFASSIVGAVSHRCKPGLTISKGLNIPKIKRGHVHKHRDGKSTVIPGVQDMYGYIKSSDYFSFCVRNIFKYFEWIR